MPNQRFRKKMKREISLIQKADVTTVGISDVEKGAVIEIKDIEQKRFGRKLCLNDSAGNHVKDPIIDITEKGYELKEPEPLIVEKIQKRIQAKKERMKKENPELSLDAVDPPNIVLISGLYTPNPFDYSLDGNVRFPVRVGFMNTLPSEYTIEVDLFYEDELLITQSANFITDSFEYNSETQRYEQGWYEFVSTPAQAIAEAAVEAAITIVSSFSVYFTVSENETPSSETSKVCSGLQGGGG